MLLGAALVCACAPLPPPVGAGGDYVVAPNRNLAVQGIPPVPRRVADEVARYGFTRKENADYQFFATVMFMRETLLR